VTAHHFTGPKGWPALTVDPQRRTWVESGKARRWTCSSCGDAITTTDAGEPRAFAEQEAARHG
jgi:hypothetical protein